MYPVARGPPPLCTADDAPSFVACVCRACVLYWGEDTDRPGEHVRIDKTPQTFAPKKGDEVPSSSLHPCVVDDSDPFTENGHRVVTITVNARISIDVPWS
jgi:hypothetical protein